MPAPRPARVRVVGAAGHRFLQRRVMSAVLQYAARFGKPLSAPGKAM
jgi:hypothetical protein